MIETVHARIVREALKAILDRRDSTFESIFAKRFTYEPQGMPAISLDQEQAKRIAEALRGIAFVIAGVEEIDDSQVKVSWVAQSNDDQPAGRIQASPPTQSQIQGASIFELRDQHVVRITAEPDLIDTVEQLGVDLLSRLILAGTSLPGNPVSQNDPFGGGSSRPVKENPFKPSGSPSGDQPAVGPGTNREKG